jgi:hypothetical protein
MVDSGFCRYRRARWRSSRIGETMSVMTALQQRVLHRLEVLLEAACPPQFELLPGPGLAISQLQYRVPDLVVVRSDRFAAATPFPVEIVPAELVAAHWRR